MGQLTFQRRWAQTPRIPQTSVLGHLLFVALVSWMVSHEVGVCPRRLYNNFFVARLVAADLGVDITEDEETFLALHAARLLDH